MISNKTCRISKNRIILNYILAYFAVAFSRISFFSGQADLKIAFCILIGIIFIIKGEKLDVFLFPIIALFVFINIFQNMTFGGLSPRNYVSFIMYYVLTPYLLIKIIGHDTPKYIIDILVVYSIISLAFWGLSNLYEPFYEYTSTIAPKYGTDFTISDNQFIIYTYESGKVMGNIIRNPGPFNEPGTFATFLLLGLVLNIMRNKGIVDNKGKILIGTIITTFSTATYLSLVVLLGYKVYHKTTNPSLKVLYLIVFIVLLVPAVLKLDFMGNKILARYQYETRVSLSEPTSGRFFGARKSIYVLKKYPFWGRGLIAGTRVTDFYSREAAGYGIFEQAARMGIIGISIYLVLFWKGIKHYCNKYNFSSNFIKWAFFSLLLSLFSQSMGLTTLFMMLIYSSFIFKSNKPQNHINSSVAA